MTSIPNDIEVRTDNRPPQTIYCPECYDDDFEITLYYKDAVLVIFEGECSGCGGKARLEYTLRNNPTR